MISENGKTINFKRIFKVDVQTLFNAWRDPQIFKLWWKDLTVAEMDCRKGGTYFLRWKQNPSEYSKGVYTEVIETKLIAFTWETADDAHSSAEKVDSTLVTVTFNSTGLSESTLELKHTLLPNENSIDDHHLGWTCALLDLDKHFNSSKRKVLEGLEAKVSRVIPFPIEQVFEAWINPKIVGQWFNRKNATLGKSGGEAKVGKNLFMDYQFESGEVSRVYCEYLEIIPKQKLTFLWASAPCSTEYDVDMQAESRVTVYFTPQGKSTKVEVIHDRLTSESAMKDYLGGWTDCLGSIEIELVKRQIHDIS